MDVLLFYERREARRIYVIQSLSPPRIPLSAVKRVHLSIS